MSSPAASLSQPPQPPSVHSSQITQMMNTYERSNSEGLKECFFANDSFSMISVDLEDHDDDGFTLNGEGGSSNGSCNSATAAENAYLRKVVQSLRIRLTQSEEEKDALRKERAAQKRELANLRKCLRANQAVADLKKKLEHMEVERDYHVREIRVLEDKVAELESINEAKTCQLDVFDKLFRMMHEENASASPRSKHLESHGCNGPPDSITLSTCVAEDLSVGGLDSASSARTTEEESKTVGEGES